MRTRVLEISADSCERWLLSRLALNLELRKVIDDHALIWSGCSRCACDKTDCSDSRRRDRQGRDSGSGEGAESRHGGVREELGVDGIRLGRGPVSPRWDDST